MFRLPYSFFAEVYLESFGYANFLVQICQLLSCLHSNRKIFLYLLVERGYYYPPEVSKRNHFLLPLFSYCCALINKALARKKGIFCLRYHCEFQFKYKHNIGPDQFVTNHFITKKVCVWTY